MSASAIVFCMLMYKCKKNIYLYKCKNQLDVCGVSIKYVCMHMYVCVFVHVRCVASVAPCSRVVLTREGV